MSWLSWIKKSKSAEKQKVLADIKKYDELSKEAEKQDATPQNLAETFQSKIGDYTGTNIALHHLNAIAEDIKRQPEKYKLSEIRSLLKHYSKYTSETNPKHLKILERLSPIMLSHFGLEHTKEEQAASAIINVLLDNQSTHKKTTFSLASSFNLKILQGLPDPLKAEVCSQLGINAAENPDILTKTDLKTRRALATILNNRLDEIAATKTIRPMA